MPRDRLAAWLRGSVSPLVVLCAGGPVPCFALDSLLLFSALQNGRQAFLVSVSHL